MTKKIRFICNILLTFFIVGLMPNNLYAIVSDADNPMNNGTSAWKKVYSTGEICVGLLDDDSLWEWCVYADNSTVLKQDKFSSPIKMLENVSDVKIGQGYILALTYDNTLWTWGTNKLGELGDGTNIDRIYPHSIMDDVIAISAGKDSSTSFAIRSDGSLWGWGYNIYGQLGDGTNISKNSPIPIEINKDKSSENPAVKSVVCGSRHTLALLNDGTLWSWGQNNYGQLGNGSNEKSYQPAKVMDNVDKIAVDGDSCFAINNQAQLFSWGCNLNMRLGVDQEGGSIMEPQKVQDDVLDVIPAPFSTYFVTSDNTLYAFGLETLNYPSTTMSNSSKVKIMDNISKVSAYYYVLAVDTSGKLWIWGDREYSTPINETANITTPTFLFDNVSDVSTDYTICSFITNDGSLFQLGNIGDNFISTPTNIAVPAYIGSVSVVENHMNVQFSGRIPETVSSTDFTVSISKTDESEKTVINEVYSFDSNLGIAVLQLEDIPQSEENSILYKVSYKGNLAVQSYLSPTPVVSYTPEPSPLPTPEPSSSSTPDPSSQPSPEPTSYSTPDPSSQYTPEPTFYSTPEPSSQYTPEPTTYSTLEPSSQPSPEPTTYSTPEPSLQPTPEPTTYSTPEPSSQPSPEPTSYSTPEPSSQLTPQPTTYSTPKPSSQPTPKYESTKSNKKTKSPTVVYPTETIPGSIPKETPVVSNVDYEKIIKDFEKEVISIVEKYRNTDDIYNEKSDLIEKEIEKAIEKAAHIKVVCENGSIDVTQGLISQQIESAIKTSSEIETFLETQDYEPNRMFRKMINIDVDLTKTQLIVNILKDVSVLHESKIDVKISTSFGNVIIYHENMDKLLSNDLKITMVDESEGLNTKIKSKVSLEFMYGNNIKIDKLDYFIGLELPYKDGNPDHCTIYNDIFLNPYSTNGQNATKTVLTLNSKNNKMQAQKSEYATLYTNDTFEYKTAYGTSNTKSYNMGGWENAENKTLKVNIKNGGKYYLIEETITFNDIKSEDTAIKEAIEVLASKGIINGRGDGSFHPDDQLSRSEFACLIVKSLNIIDESAFANFEDVKDTSWFYNSVAIAYNEGLISGYEDNTFKGAKKINRQEIITICATTLNTKKGYLFPNGDKWLNFTDKNLIPSWARKFVSLGNRESLIVKRSDGKFNGTEFCTRKDAAVILYRLYKKL